MRVGVKRPSGPIPTVNIRLDRILKSAWDAFAAKGVLPPYAAPFIEGAPISPDLAPWYESETGLWLSGRLDAAVSIAGIVVPVDHKARGYPPNQIHEAYVLQLDVYELLLAGNGYPTGGYGLLVYHVLEGPEHPDIGLHGLPLAIAVEAVATDVERAKGWLCVARQVLDLEDPPDPAPSCEFCAWARSAGAA